MPKFNLSREILRQRKKVLLGTMDILILQWAEKKPISGQDIINKIQKEVDVKLGPGTVYPILYSLKKRGLVHTKQDKKKILYLLTKNGKKVTNKSSGLDLYID